MFKELFIYSWHKELKSQAVLLLSKFFQKHTKVWSITVFYLKNIINLLTLPFCKDSRYSCSLNVLTFLKE